MSDFFELLKEIQKNRSSEEQIQLQKEQLKRTNELIELQQEQEQRERNREFEEYLQKEKAEQEEFNRACMSVKASLSRAITLNPSNIIPAIEYSINEVRIFKDNIKCKKLYLFYDYEMIFTEIKKCTELFNSINEKIKGIKAVETTLYGSNVDKKLDFELEDLSKLEQDIHRRYKQLKIISHIKWIFSIILVIIGVFYFYHSCFLKSQKYQDKYNSELKPFINNWIVAWEQTAAKNSTTDYKEYYSENFKSGDYSFESWMKNKLKRAKEERSIDVQISDLKIHEITYNTAKISFNQNYKSKKNSDFGRKTLWLQKENGKWKIYREDWKQKFKFFLNSPIYFAHLNPPLKSRYVGGKLKRYEERRY